ncbi:MAG TPA: DUF1987 domain-containing protein [Dokdonella sp.]
MSIEKLQRSATASTPTIDFDPHSGVLRLSGESYPENAFEYFRPLLAWAGSYVSQARTPIVAEIALSYLNTSSIKSVMDLLDILEAAHRKGSTVSVRWSYAQDNERALEMIEEFKEEVTLPFFIVPVAT